MMRPEEVSKKQQKKAEGIIPGVLLAAINVMSDQLGTTIASLLHPSINCLANTMKRIDAPSTIAYLRGLADALEAPDDPAATAKGNAASAAFLEAACLHDATPEGRA